MKRHPTKIDLLVLIGLPLLAFFLSLVIRSPYHIVSSILIYGLPALYLILRYRDYSFVIKDIIFVILISTPFAIIIDYIGIVSGLWFDPKTVISYKLLGVVPVDDIIWMFLATYLIVIFYNTFFDKGKREFFDKKMWHFILPSTIALSIFLYIFAMHPEILYWQGRYVYLILGTVFFLLPAVIFIFFHPRFFKKSLWVVVYFLYVTLLLELVATHLNQWVFGGTYITEPFSLFGFGYVSFEELFFVGIVGPFAAISLYEFFDDDKK